MESYPTKYDSYRRSWDHFKVLIAINLLLLKILLVGAQLILAQH